MISRSKGTRAAICRLRGILAEQQNLTSAIQIARKHVKIVFDWRKRSQCLSSGKVARLDESRANADGALDLSKTRVTRPALGMIHSKAPQAFRSERWCPSISENEQLLLACTLAQIDCLRSLTESLSRSPSETQKSHQQQQRANPRLRRSRAGVCGLWKISTP